MNKSGPERRVQVRQSWGSVLDDVATRPASAGCQPALQISTIAFRLREGTMMCVYKPSDRSDVRDAGRRLDGTAGRT